MRFISFPIILCICIIFIAATLSSQAQILIDATKNTNAKPTDSAHTLLELRGDTTNTSAQIKGLLLPRADSANITKTKNNAKIPNGALIYDSSNHTIVVRRADTWSALTYSSGTKKTANPQILDITTSDTVLIGATLDSITVKTPSGYKLYKENSNPNPYTEIAYNGITLTPGKDYTIRTLTGSSGTTNTTDSVRIIFKSVMPEDWKGFSRFSVQYIATTP